MSGDGYRGMIVRATGCTYEAAAEIEELMRVGTGGTLDHLTRREFEALAREAEAAVEILREQATP